MKAIPSTTHIIILTENWITSEEDAKSYELSGYRHIFNYRLNSRGGGVSIYLNNTIKYEITVDLIENRNHYLWIEINKLSLNIGVIYKPPDTNVKEFLDVYCSQIKKRKRCIVFGDFNIDTLKKTSSSKEYLSAVEDLGYTFLNKNTRKYSTRVTNSTSTILDHVWTNLPNHEFNFSIIKSSLSDHRQIFLEITKMCPQLKKSVTYEAINYEGLHKDGLKKDFLNKNNDITTLEKDISVCVKDNKVNKIKILNAPRDEWINREILNAINKRNLLSQNYLADKNNINLKEKHTKAQDTVHKLVKLAKKNHFENLFEKCSGNSKKTWELIDTLARNKTQDICTVPKLVIGSIPISDGNKVCEIFNNFFSSVGSTLASQIDHRYHVSTTHSLMYKSDYAHTISLPEFEPCTRDEIIKIISSLDNNSSSGVDGISTKSIKCLKDSIAESLSNCINKCLTEGTFPNTLKIAKVSPIYKSGVKTDPSNYRPISVLPIISKIFERILYNRLYTYLKEKGFLIKQQYGFRPKCSTLSATMDLITKIKLNIDKKHIALGIFIDLKKAFDTISHSKLIKKLHNLGITGPALKIFESYLSDRQQIVKIGDFKSSPQQLSYGIPQGSIIGPLLFLIYVNDISNVGLTGHLTMYADDTCLFYYGHNLKNIIDEAQKDLDLLNMWFLHNLLTINVAKTSYMIFAAKNKKILDNIPLKINNQVLHRSTHEKYLGLWLDERLTWGKHVAHVNDKLRAILRLLWKASNCIPYKHRKMIYNALVKSHLQYLIEIWGTASQTILKDLQITQNKLIKVLFHLNKFTPTKEVYKTTKIFDLKTLYKYNSCILIKKIITGTIQSDTTFTQRTYTHNLRKKNKLFIPVPRTLNYGKKNISYEGVQFYNNLPESIKNCKSVYKFKKQLQVYLIEKQ